MTDPSSLKNLILDAALNDSPADPTIPQRNAAIPSRHVWVRASAGSGKTKVLVDRLLRLLLPDPDTEAPGVAPDKILCLTFTKAGAAEMALRLQKSLLSWSSLSDEKLQQELNDLIGGTAKEHMFKAARRLLARLLDAPSRLRILTIHSFCQSILGRFPVETGLSPDFTVIEEAEAKEYIQKSLIDALLHASQTRTGDLAGVFSRLSVIRNLNQLQDDLRPILNEPLKLQRFIGHSTNLRDIRHSLATALDLPDIDNVTIESFCHDDNTPRQSLSIMASILDRSSKGDQEKADQIRTWLSASHHERIKGFDDYKALMKLKPGGKVAKEDPDFLERLEREKERLDRLALADNIRSTADLLYLSSYILKSYEAHKRHMGVLDYNDLIFMTSRLLSGEIKRPNSDNFFSTQWVLYKLDEGIDHILVDESQDTNPDQWAIIRQLSDDFFSNQSVRNDRPRSLFVVGDEKQSIFSFQRADPAEFHRMKDYFAEKVSILGQDKFEESLIFSFRSTAPLLKLVDAVFEDASLRDHIGMKPDQTLRHISYRSDKNLERYGSVELWPLTLMPEKPTQAEGWNLPFSEERSSDAPSAQQRLARQIASRIQSMILKGEASAGDFLILMRSRTALMLHIIRELKALNIPVSGLDRIVLSESLIIQDLLAVCDFALLPDYDFALASLLKSPFIGMSEDDLMTLASSRPTSQSLYATLRADPRHSAITTWLDQLIALSCKVQPYEFLDDLLTRPCPADPEGSGYRACQARLGYDTIEPLDEILNQTLKIELQDIRTLQDFVTYQRNQTRDIKREMEEASGQVRIMTVHASKGLEAPIVILPDTTSAPAKNKGDAFLWPDKSGLNAPLWAPSQPTRSKLHTSALDHAHELQIKESSRLLYVALTRARDHVIMCGVAKKPEPQANSWYSAALAGFNRIESVEKLDNGTLIYKIEGAAAAANAKPSLSIEPLPAWARENAPIEDDRLNILTPSHQGLDENEVIYSPLDQSSQHRFKRGLATHKLLQILPDLDPVRREAAALSYVARESLALPPDLQASIVQETLAVLNDPVFAPVFGAGSIAEVPVTGKIASGQRINGQIDRLIITDDTILIVDFKTNRPSPDNSATIPASYRAQLKAYAAALSAIYPRHTIKCALLWTDRPLLMPVSF